MKYGIYEDYGNFTCGGYPGVLGHLALDAQTLADWGTDYVKLDGCYVDANQMDEGINNVTVFKGRYHLKTIHIISQFPLGQVA